MKLVKHIFFDTEENEQGHIMHPDYHEMGDGFWAPKK